MTYLLDTDTYIFNLEGIPSVVSKVSEQGENEIYLSSLSVAELYYGIFRSLRKESNLFKIRKHLAKTQILNFTKHTAFIFGQLKADLAKKNQLIEDADLGIASIALQHELILVTHNTHHFQRIPLLLLEDWKKG